MVGNRISRRDFLRLGAGLAVVGLAACEGQEQAPSTPTPVVTGPPLKVGIIEPNSGVFADLGRDQLNGFNLYLEKVNSVAGGRRIQLVVEDETADPATALTKARKLIEADRVEMLAGVISSASALAMRDLVHQSRIFTVISNASANDITRARKSPYIFRVSNTNYQMAFPLGKWLIDNGHNRIVLMFADYAAGREVAAAIREGFATGTGEIVDTIPFPLGNTDFSSVIDRIRASRVNMVAGFAAGTDAVIFLRQFAQAGLAGRIQVALHDSVDRAEIAAVGRDALGVYTSDFWAPTLDNPANRQFVDEYRRRYNEEPSRYAVAAYDAARVLVETINAVNGDTSDPDRLVRAAESIRFDSPRGLFEFDPATHHVVQNIYLRQVREQGGRVMNTVVSDLGRIRDPG
jgi:branched-chain amino acid transport system substrate-binding protein